MSSGNDIGQRGDIQMSHGDLITKVTQILQRQDGSEVRITSQECGLPGQSRSIDIYVHQRESPDHVWRLLSDRPHPDWKQMSVDEYIKHGRSEKQQAVSFAELVKVTSLIGKPISSL